MTVEYVIAENQHARVARQELFAQNKRLRQPIRARLNHILQVDSPLAAIAQQALKRLLVMLGGNNQNIPNARKHESSKRVINHGLVVNRHQLFAGTYGERIYASARTAIDNYPYSAHP